MTSHVSWHGRRGAKKAGGKAGICTAQGGGGWGVLQAAQAAELDDKRTRIELETASFDGFSVVWTPGTIFKDLGTSGCVHFSSEVMNRGRILDRNGLILASSVVAPSI